MAINERRDYLLDKLRAKTLDEEEAIELRMMLENEKKNAISIGDIAVVLAIAILLGLLADYLSKHKFRFW